MRPDGTDNVTWTKGAAAVVVFFCLFAGLWLIVFKATRVLLRAIGAL